MSYDQFMMEYKSWDLIQRESGLPSANTDLFDNFYHRCSTSNQEFFQENTVYITQPFIVFFKKKPDFNEKIK